MASRLPARLDMWMRVTAGCSFSDGATLPADLSGYLLFQRDNVDRLAARILELEEEKSQQRKSYKDIRMTQSRKCNKALRGARMAHCQAKPRPASPHLSRPLSVASAVLRFCLHHSMDLQITRCGSFRGSFPAPCVAVRPIY